MFVFNNTPEQLARIVEASNAKKPRLLTDAEKAHLHELMSMYKRLNWAPSRVVLCGSIGLLAHGITLGRLYTSSDLDLIFEKQPFFFLKEDNYGSGDFTHRVRLGGLKVEGIKRKCEFKETRFMEWAVSVSPLEEILSNKYKYACKGSPKHQKDIMDFLGLGAETPCKLIYDELPF